MKTVIETHDVCKIYKAAVPVNAVDHVTLSINESEFTALVGPSGSGKTTLLNLLGGLDRPSSGSVRVHGTDLNTLSDSELIRFRLQHIGFVFQSFNLVPVLTARENAEFILLLQGVPKRARNERVEALLRDVGLPDKMDSRPDQLSGGQQQRVAVARALASRPDFVLADEPTANLDGRSASHLLDIMEHLNHEEGMTFLFSTHDPRVIERAHRIITLEDGRIRSDEHRNPHA